MMVSRLLASSVEVAVNGVLSADPERTFLLEPLQGQSLAVEVVDWRLTLCFIPQGDRMQVVVNRDVDAGVTLSGDLSDLIRLVRSDQPQAVLATKAVQLSGDAAVLQAYQQLMQQFELDWEGLLAKAGGQRFAAAAAKPIRHLAKRHKAHWQSTKADLREWLQEEKRCGPPREEVEDFFTDAAQFRQDLTRFEARLRRVSSK